jgi:L-alanine-DL-glutamate epimerase-like enolase superfamily enzyme
MSLRDLCLLYLVFGCFFAIAIYRSSPETKSTRLGSAALAVPLWPLWAPIALTAKRADKPTFLGRTNASSLALERVKTALADAVASIQGTPLATLLPPESASRIEAEVVRREKRLAELETLLAKDAFDVARLESRVGDLEKRGGSPRTLSTARLDLENVRRLSALRDRDARALEELCALVEALRTQVTLARFSGSSAADIGGIVGEVWARVEGLGAAIEAEESLHAEEAIET